MICRISSQLFWAFGSQRWSRYDHRPLGLLRAEMSRAYLSELLLHLKMAL